MEQKISIPCICGKNISRTACSLTILSRRVGNTARVGKNARKKYHFRSLHLQAQAFCADRIADIAQSAGQRRLTCPGKLQLQTRAGSEEQAPALCQRLRFRPFGPRIGYTRRGAASVVIRTALQAWSTGDQSVWRSVCCRAEVRRSFITTTVRDESQVTPQGRHR